MHKERVKDGEGGVENQRKLMRIEETGGLSNTSIFHHRHLRAVHCLPLCWGVTVREIAPSGPSLQWKGVSLIRLPYQATHFLAYTPMDHLQRNLCRNSCIIWLRHRWYVPYNSASFFLSGYTISSRVSNTERDMLSTHTPFTSLSLLPPKAMRRSHHREHPQQDGFHFKHGATLTWSWLLFCFILYFLLQLFLSSAHNFACSTS